MASESFLWSEKYRPRKIEDCILPEKMTRYFTDIVKRGHLDNMTFIGTAGVGKTTVAKALCEEMGIGHLLINASESGNIDTIRTTVRQYASTVSLQGGIKAIILDEADGLTNQAQQALRGAIEEYSANCRFIFTGNFGNRIIEPIISRAPLVDFTIDKAERPKILIKFANRIFDILKKEEVEFNEEELFAVIKKNFPDYRRTLNLLQRYCSSGKLEISSQYGIDDVSLNELVRILKGKEFGAMRKWVVEHLDNDGAGLRRAIYDKVCGLLKSDSIPQIILTLAEYDYKESFVIDKEINMVAMLTMIMADAAWL